MSFTQKILPLAVLMALSGVVVAAGGNTIARANANNPAGQANNPAAIRAQGMLQTPGLRAAARASVNDRFIARNVVVDRDGTEHVRFDRTYAGLPVIGGDLVVHSRNNQLKSTSLSLGAVLNLNTRARLKAADAIVNAGVEFGSNFIGMPTSTLVVYAREVGAPKLAWQVNFLGSDKTDGPVDATYFVDAQTGKVLDHWSNIETVACTSTLSATGTGRTLYAGNVAINSTNCGGSFQLKDQTRGGNYTTDMSGSQDGNGTIFSDADNIWGDNTTADRASAGAQAHFSIAATWDYYKNIHGRSGIANDGKGILIKVHYGQNFGNAFWQNSCLCISFGDGNSSIGTLNTLDLAGHEMTHGVTWKTAALLYSGESGGLNEATSDIMGTMVEFYVNNPLETPDYLLGEGVFLTGTPTPLRYMFNPYKDGRSPNCYIYNLGKMDVHYSSGIANHFFYLLAEGSGPKTFGGVDHTSPTCNGLSVAGITRAKAEKIWYRALTVYMTSNTNYAGARTATLSASKDLYGINSVESKAVAAAWNAVLVR